jgi:hypothetical protein
MYSKEIFMIIKIVFIGILVFIGISYLINSNHSQILDPVASKTSVVYNIKRESFDYEWKGGTFTLNLNGKKVDMYLNTDIIENTEDIFADNKNLVIRDTCGVVQVKIDLETAKINNDLTSIHFNDELEPMDIITDIRCI